MFAALEKRANILCAAILIATIVVGKMFGGALKGLIPLAMCLSSGVFLWMKEVVRSGREVEWDSEAVRGQMVRVDLDLWHMPANFARHLSIFCQSPSSG